MKKRRILLSYSGGETSGFMLYYMLKKYRNDPDVELLTVFANTGDEWEETLIFADKCDKYFNAKMVWVECITNPVIGIGATAKVVDFSTASRNAEPFKSMVAKYGIPNVGSPHCSRELKLSTIRAYARSIGWTKYETAIGIRFDEPSRLDWAKAKKERILYPLATEVIMRKPQVSKFWSSMPFRLKLKTYEGNCKTCWKKSLRKLMTIAVENPHAFAAFQAMELEYENFIPESKRQNEKLKPPIRFFRDNRSVLDIFEEAESPFDKARDERFDYSFQTDLWVEELDGNFGCVESCEVI